MAIRVFRRQFGVLLLAAWLCGSALAADPEAASADDPLVYSGPARTGDEMWLVNTREIKKASAKDPGLHLLRFNEESGWGDAELEALAAKPTDGAQTVIYVHGYGFDPDKAERVGWAMYHELRKQLPQPERLRFIIWSWPSTAIKYRFVRDMRDKARRCNTEAYFLAWLLSQVDADAVIGSALGCRAVTGSLHLLAGKAPTLNTSITKDDRSKKLRVVLVSPAIDNDWLLPGEFHGKAVTQVKQMLLLNNSEDPTLANYAAISPKRNAIALGLSGLVSIDKLSDAADRIEQVDAVEHIGEEHGVENYLRSAPIVEQVGEFIRPSNVAK